MSETTRIARDRKHPLQAYATPDERKRVAERAKAAGLTLSSYIRAACLSTRVIAPRDRVTAEALLQANADQARLGNLLKLYLQDPNADRVAAQRLIRSIEETQGELKAIIRKINV